MSKTTACSANCSAKFQFWNFKLLRWNRKFKLTVISVQLEIRLFMGPASHWTAPAAMAVGSWLSINLLTPLFIMNPKHIYLSLIQFAHSLINISGIGISLTETGT
ncbi:hypothetical protein NPIL_531541 [Nephila pilipes]|uniref:Uncharacterized protein n=1 Tax=Nephila pilipes TaxID=299642 RepID=A0A8X6PHF8_NEPPI|nr:hypothetical protein NPIL_531541 [Nephila pilipes]